MNADRSPLRPRVQCEHHIHIEGTLEPKMLFALAERHDMTLDPSMYSTIPALEERFVALSPVLTRLLT